MRFATDANAILEEIEKRNPRVEIDGVDYWVVEGDLIMSPSELRLYAIERAEEAQRRLHSVPVIERQGLLAKASTDGRIVRWSKRKELTYCICRVTFEHNETEYQQAVAAMEHATRDWESVCGIKFRHLDDFDSGSPGGSELPLFDVRRDRRYSNLLAAAFFPDSLKANRHIWIYDAFFDFWRNPYGIEGVLRHEVGHVLGFRHEHIREGAPTSCRQAYGYEDSADVIPLTHYDHTSVMHYQCPDARIDNPKWILTDKDQEGAQAVYGAPDGTRVPADDIMDYRD
jgi:hypothetical protein